MLTHTDTCIQIYKYVRVCVCVCVVAYMRKRDKKSKMWTAERTTETRKRCEAKETQRMVQCRRWLCACACALPRTTAR